MTYIRLITFACLMMLGSCKVLTPGQIKNINVFAEATAGFSDYPGNLVRARSGLMFDRGLVAATLFTGDDLKKTVEATQNNFEFEQKIADSLDLPYRLLKQYALLLQELSGSKYSADLLAEKDDFGKRFGDLLAVSEGRVFNGIPIGIGSAITEAIFLAGERLTKNQQARALKTFIPQGQVIIDSLHLYLKRNLEGNFKALIASDSSAWFKTYTSTILNNEDKISYASVLQYSQAVNAFNNLEKLRLKCIEASGKMVQAHTKMTQSINSPVHYKELFQETKSFGKSVADLYKLYKQIGKSAS